MKGASFFNMPWQVYKKGNEWCVFKHDADHKPIGKSLGCHPDEASAKKQLAALYVNEKKSMDVMKATLQKKGSSHYPSSAFLVVEDAKESSKWHLRVKDVGGKLNHRLMGAAWAALHEGYRGNKYEGPDKEEALAKLKRLYKQEGMSTPGEKKSISLAELDEKVRKAIKEKVMDATGMHDEWEYNIWTDVLWDFAIVHAPAGLFKVDWNVVDEETYEVEIGDPVPVKIEYVETDREMPEEEPFADIMTRRTADLSLIKSLGDNRIGAYAVLWGDETKKDLSGEWFDQKTEELSVIYDTIGKLPFMYHHGLDQTVKTSVVGVVDTLKPDNIGLWYEAQLKLANEYEKHIKRLIDDGKLKTSTQTFAAARKVNAKSGHIDRWPIVEITATPSPMEYRMMPIAGLKSAYQEVGCTDFTCMLKTKLGIEVEDWQGAEKARLLLNLENARLAFAEL